MNNREIRQLAWDRLMKGRWFWKLLGVSILLQICARTALVVLEGMLDRLDVCSWFTYLMIVAENRETLTTPVPELTREFLWRATTATALEMFIGVILIGIVAYGTATVLLKFTENNENRYLADAFGGFKMPFTLAGILFLRSLIVISYLVLAIIPAYRYRYVFFIKAENPDLPIREVFRRCRTLMDGHKWEAFMLDCSYWKPIMLMLVFPFIFAILIGVCAILGENSLWLIPLALIMIISILAFFALMIFVPQYMAAGQAIFYRKLIA